MACACAAGAAVVAPAGAEAFPALQEFASETDAIVPDAGLPQPRLVSNYLNLYEKGRANGRRARPQHPASRPED